MITSDSVQADHVHRRPAERRLGLRVPIDDAAGGVDADECVVRGVDDHARPHLAVREAGRGLPPLLVDQCDNDEIGHRDGKVLFIDRPRSFTADMLCAEHSQRGAILAQRHVEHRPDTERDEIRVGKFAGPRIRARVMSRDHPFPAERLEISRGGGIHHRRGALVMVSSEGIQIDARDRPAIVCAPPQAEAFDLQRAGRCDQNRLQAAEEPASGIGVPLRELRQGVALRRQSPFTGRQLLPDVVVGRRRTCAGPLHDLTSPGKIPAWTDEPPSATNATSR